MENCILIKQPYITVNDNLYRLNAEVIENGISKILFVEVEAEYGQYLCFERSDAFLLLVIPIALRFGYDIYCEAPVTEMFLHNIREILIPSLALGDKKIKNIEIFASTVSEIMSGNAVGTAISCGVDSTYTVMEYTNNKYKEMQLSHLFIGSLSFEMWNIKKDKDLHSWKKNNAEALRKCYDAANELNLPLVTAFTNFIKYPVRDKDGIIHVKVHTFITMATVLALKKLWKIYYLSSAYDFTKFNLLDNTNLTSDEYDLLMVHVLSTPGFYCFSGGAKAPRAQKTIELADYSFAQNHLHPCFTLEKKNCSKPECKKCLRALLALDCYDKLDNMRNVFDVDLYNRNKPHYFFQLIKQKKYDHLLNELYDKVCEKYPLEVEKALKAYNRSIEPVSRSDYNNMVFFRDFLLQLTTFNEPKKVILDFFTSRNISSLYYAGHKTIVGNKVIELISDVISCKDYQTGDVNDCDAVLISLKDTKGIKQLKRKMTSPKPIYILSDVFEYMKTISEK